MGGWSMSKLNKLRAIIREEVRKSLNEENKSLNVFKRDIKEDLDPYKDFSVKGQNKKYDLNLGAFVDAYQKCVKFMKKHKEVPDGNKKEWALQIREKVGQSMFNGYIGLFTQPIEVLERSKKFEKLKNKDFHFSEGKEMLKLKELLNEAPDHDMFRALNKVNNDIFKIMNKYDGKADMDAIFRSWMLGLHAKLKKAGIELK